MWLSCLFIFIGIGMMYAQTTKITGTVMSEEDGFPVVGASVLVKGTSVGTVTDIDGNFTFRMYRKTPRHWWFLSSVCSLRKFLCSR